MKLFVISTIGDDCAGWEVSQMVPSSVSFPFGGRDECVLRDKSVSPCRWHASSLNSSVCSRCKCVLDLCRRALDLVMMPFLERGCSIKYEYIIYTLQIKLARLFYSILIKLHFYLFLNTVVRFGKQIKCINGSYPTGSMESSRPIVVACLNEWISTRDKEN